MKEEATNVLVVGVGGQGAVMATELISEVAMNAGYDVKKSEVHGMSQRGESSQVMLDMAKILLPL